MEHQFTSDDGSVRVTLENIGEGLSGDYDPSDPSDINLLRFSVSRRDTTGSYEEIDDASYCTNIRADAPDDIKQLAGQTILAEVESDARSGRSIKRRCELLSWMNSDEIVVLQIALAIHRGDPVEDSPTNNRLYKEAETCASQGREYIPADPELGIKQTVAFRYSKNHG